MWKKILMIVVIAIVVYYFLFDGKEVVDEYINKGVEIKNQLMEDYGPSTEDQETTDEEATSQSEETTSEDQDKIDSWLTETKDKLDKGTKAIDQLINGKDAVDKLIK